MNKSQYEPYKPEESCDGKLFWSLSEPEAGAPWKMCAGIKKIEIIWDYHITTPRSHNEDLEQCLGSILKLEDGPATNFVLILITRPKTSSPSISCFLVFKAGGFNHSRYIYDASKVNTLYIGFFFQTLAFSFLFLC